MAVGGLLAVVVVVEVVRIGLLLWLCSPAGLKIGLLLLLLLGLCKELVRKLDGDNRLWFEFKCEGPFCIEW